MSAENIIKNLYALDVWPMDPYSKRGQERFRKGIEVFNKLMKHDWLQKLVKKGKIRIIEICAGTGIGGVALAKALEENNVNTQLLLTDIREDALKLGAKWGTQVLGKKVEYLRIDARKVHELGRKFDIALMYGFSSPHFDPWDMLRLQASISECLADDGILIMDEGDRIYSIFYIRGYANILPERIDEQKTVLSLHAGYDFVRGTFSRAYIDLKNPSKVVLVKHYFWGLAELMAIIWMFFYDVDFFELRQGAGLILGHRPRRKIRIADLNIPPRVFKSI